jgi:hypothetical protein
VPALIEGYHLWELLQEKARGLFEYDFPRYLAYEFGDLCRATDSELYTCLPEDLPKIGIINSWHHQSYYIYDPFNDRNGEVMGVAPSSYETFPMIAKVLVSENMSDYRPTLPANNHWSNWPNAGGL